MNPVVDLILHSSQVHTMDPGLGVVQAVAISGARTVAVGNDEGLAPLAGPGVRTVNLDGQVVVPGFIDPHLHVLDMALLRQVADLRGASSRIEHGTLMGPATRQRVARLGCVIACQTLHITDDMAVLSEDIFQQETSVLLHTQVVMTVFNGQVVCCRQHFTALLDKHMGGETSMLQADLLLQNGTVYLVEPAHTRAQAVAVRDGHIFAVGSDSELAPLIGSKTRVIDLKGRLVLPGFTDSHTHFLVYALRRHQVVLDGVDDWQEIRYRIRAGVERAAPGECVLGWGWNQNLWGDGTFPSKADLDDIAPRNPVALTRTDFHTLWVNSLALEKAGITAEMPDLPGSRIDRDPATGEPSGILREWGAVRLVEDVIPMPSDDVVDAALRETIAEAHQLGLTGVHDMRLETDRLNALQSFQRLYHRGELALRVSCALPVDLLDEAMAVGLGSGLGNATLRVGGVKVFTDGSMGSGTAWMLEPYADDPSNYGLAVTPKDQLLDIARRAEQAGLSLIIHAIGDRAIREVLDVLAEVKENRERGMENGLRHRIEHTQIIHPDDIPRLAPLGVIASMQPVHVMDDWPVADQVWGLERSRTAYAFRSLLDAGTHLTFGSDCPVAPLNPLLGIQAAVLRQNEKGEPKDGWYPEERLKVAEAVRGYTMGPAYTVGLEDVLGSITPGKLADLVVLDRDIFEIESVEIASVKPLMTIFDGRVVYQT